MGQRLIISEEERSRISGMYGLVNEQKAGDKAPLEQLPKQIQDFVKKYNLTGYFNYSSVNGKIGERFGYNKGNTHSDIAVSDIQTYEKYEGQASKCVEKEEYFKKTLADIMNGNESEKDPRMKDRNKRNYCEKFPNDPRCPGNQIRDERKAREEAKRLTNEKFPNMEFCSVLGKVRDIIDM